MSSGQAFGVALDTEFELPGLRAFATAAAGEARLTLAARRDLLAGWPADAERISTPRRPDGRASGSWERHPEAGLLLRAPGFGTFQVAADGSSGRCAPVRVAGWRWQRYLVGQVLPLLSMLHGHEVFHASVVARDGRAVALVGRSGAGKSSLAAGLVLRGFRYVADDVLAIRPGTGLSAQPGIALTSLRWDAADRLTASDRARIGTSVGQDDEAIRLAIDMVDGAVPLAALYVLERQGDGGSVIDPVRPVDPRLLLAASYNFVMADRARRIRQLDVCAELASGAAVHRVTSGAGATPADTTDLLDRHIAGSSAP